MFNQNTSTDTKIAVLEERLSSYELMIKKIDEAIQIMGKTSQNISKMLAVHEEKIEQCHKSDDNISKLIEELKSENKTSHEAVIVRIEKVENKFSFAMSQSHMVVDILTPDAQQVQVKNK